MRRTHPLDYPCPHTRDMPFNNLVSRRAEHQRASRVYRGEQRIAVLEAVLEVGEGFAQLFDEPVEFAVLSGRREGFNQHPRGIHLEHLFSRPRSEGHRRWCGVPLRPRRPL